MKLGLLIGGLLLVAPGLVACGGGDDDKAEDTGSDKKTVSVEDFCAAAEKFESTFDDLDTTDMGATVKTFKAAAQELKDAGTPEDIPDDAREGLVLTLDKIIGLPDDATEEEMGELFNFSEEEQKKSMAFETYLDDTCDYRADES